MGFWHTLCVHCGVAPSGGPQEFSDYPKALDKEAAKMAAAVAASGRCALPAGELRALLRGREALTADWHAFLRVSPPASGCGCHVEWLSLLRETAVATSFAPLTSLRPARETLPNNERLLCPRCKAWSVEQIDRQRMRIWDNIPRWFADD